MGGPEVRSAVEGKSEVRSVWTSGPHPLSYACKFLADPFVRAQLNRFNELWIEKNWRVFNGEYERAAELVDQHLDLRDALDCYLDEHYPQ